MELTGKKILVTGADGFIGSHLVETLLAQQLDVRAFTQYNSLGRRGWLDYLPTGISDNIEFHAGDIRDAESVRKALTGCDVVLHLAALIAIPYSYEASESYVDTNIKGTLNVLKAARELGTSKMVHTSTSEVYGSAQYVPIDEKHPLVGQSPYAATKIGADQMAESFYRSFEVPVTTLRPFNTFGPRQSTRAVIPTIIAQIANGKNTISLGDLNPTRDFSYVEDTAHAFIATARSDKAIGEVINFGSGFEISIAETASLISELMEKQVTIATNPERIRPKSSEVQRLYADIQKAKNLLDIDPQFGRKDGFRNGLAKTIDWFTSPQNLAMYQDTSYKV